MESSTVPDTVHLGQLRSVGLFAGLDDRLLEELFTGRETERVEPGTVVFREGEDGRSMYVVLGGELDVQKRADVGRNVRVAVLGPGDWFGEMAVLDIMSRSATVRAVAPSRLMQVGTADLDRLYRTELKAYTLLMMNLARELSRRLRVADAILANATANARDDS